MIKKWQLEFEKWHCLDGIIYKDFKPKKQEKCQTKKKGQKCVIGCTKKGMKNLK